MRLLAIDDLFMGDLDLMELPLLTDRSDDLAYSTRRQQGLAGQSFFGGASEPAIYDLAFRCETFAARDAVIGALTSELGRERRLLMRRADAEATPVIGYAAVIKIVRASDLSFHVELEASDSAWVSERSTRVTKAVLSERDHALYVAVPGVGRIAPTVLISPLAARTAPSATVGWSKRRRYTITNLSDEPWYRYPLRVDLGDSAALVAAAKARADGNDLRLWIDGIEQSRTLVDWNTVTSFLWFVVPALLPGDTLAIDIVYGNSAAGPPPGLAYPDLPAFDLAASSNALHVYRSDDVVGNAGRGVWWLSKGSEGAIADFGTPGAWQPMATLENPDSTDRTLQTRALLVPATTAYIATLDAWRASSDSTVVNATNPFDGVGLFNPLGIVSMTCGFTWTNIGGWSTLVVVGRDSASEGWDVIYSNAGATATIASAARTPTAPVKWIACAVWPDNFVEVLGTALATDYARAVFNSDVSVAIDSTKVAIALGETELEAWTPSHLGAALQAWYDATAIQGLADNAPVTKWDDLSGNARHAVDQGVARRPTYQTNEINGLPAVAFDGGDDYLAPAGLLAATRNRTLLAVLRQDVLETAAILGAAANGLGFWCDALGHVLVVKNGVANLAVSAATMAAGSVNLVAATVTPTTITFAVNGTAEPPVANATVLAAGVLHYLGVNAGIVHPFDGEMGEVIYTTALTAEDRQNAEGYLAHKWGLLSRLPGDHPYKVDPPTAIASVTEADIYEVASEVRLGGGDTRVPPYHALLVGNARAESGAGTRRVACQLSEAIVINAEARTQEIWRADLTQRVEGMSAHTVRGVVGWQDGDLVAESPTSEWLPLTPHRPVTPNGGFAADIGGWEADTSSALLSVARTWDAAVGGEVLGALAMAVTANTAPDEIARTIGPKRFLIGGRASVWVTAWMQTAHAQLHPLLYLRFYDEDDVVLVTAMQATWTPTRDEGVRRTFAARVPGRTSYVRVGVAVRSAASGALGTVWFDDIRVNDTDLYLHDQAVGEIAYTAQLRGVWI